MLGVTPLKLVGRGIFLTGDPCGLVRRSARPRCPLLFFAFPVFAAIPEPSSAAPLSEADFAQHTTLFAEIDLPEGRSCRTGLVLSLRDHWDHLSADERTYASAALAPGRADLFGPRPLRDSTGAPPPAKAACWSAEMDNTLDTENFHIEYEDGVDIDDIEQFAEDLELSWNVEVNDAGWDPPAGTDAYLTSIYVQNANTYGAYTSSASCNGTDMAYIVTGKDSWGNKEWGATMASHEFNHAVQYGYSDAPEFWWWEATATWIESVVYPNSYLWSWYVAGYSDNPWIAFDAEDQRDREVFNHMYGMAIWAFYLEDYMGGADILRQTWENAKDESGYYTYGADDMLDDLGEDFDAAYADFVIKNAAMEYVESQAMPDVDLKDTVSSFPADGKSSGNDVPQGYGQNYIKFDKGSDEGTLKLKFTGDDGVKWLVALVEARKHEIYRTESAQTEDGAATLTLDNFGAEDVFLVISPLTTRSGEYDYEWEATTEEPSADDDDTGVDDTGDVNDTDDDDNSGGESGDEPATTTPTGCNDGGCSAGGGAPLTGVVTAVMAGFLAGRRRR